MFFRVSIAMPFVVWAMPFVVWAMPFVVWAMPFVVLLNFGYYAFCGKNYV